MIAEQEFGERLQALRDELGLAGTEVAERAGIGASTYYRLENGLQRPRGATLRRLARGLGFHSTEELLARLDEETLERVASRLAPGQDGAGEVEDAYVTHFAGGEEVDDTFEDAIAEEYLRIFREEEATDEVFKLAVKRAFALGKERGRRLKEPE